MVSAKTANEKTAASKMKVKVKVENNLFIGFILL
jgi:hypothetical protein